MGGAGVSWVGGSGASGLAELPGLLDHVVVAGPDLAHLVDWFAELTGVRAAAGGAHPTGSANALVALSIAGARGPQYLELIGPDPDRASPELPAVFGIGSRGAAAEPWVHSYAVHPPRIAETVALAHAAGVELGPVRELSRLAPDGTLLEWRLTLGADGQQAARPELPFLIDWGATRHPGESTDPVVELLEFARVEPDPAAAERLERELAALGLGAGVARVLRGEPGEDPGYRLTLRGPSGEAVSLGV
ncbi:glyoxalase-like protein [Leucobacter luti]|uniref:VOC family protein n=1 Tax=Leucobacter luti TaxID=340320 RepID=UPI001046BCB4|nr:VOC family protein [Leucobacter luti]TCK37795.1 glyoxalase-like protein [Leucobacter luti]